MWLYVLNVVKCFVPTFISILFADTSCKARGICSNSCPKSGKLIPKWCKISFVVVALSSWHPQIWNQGQENHTNSYVSSQDTLTYHLRSISRNLEFGNSPVGFGSYRIRLWAQVRVSCPCVAQRPITPSFHELSLNHCCNYVHIRVHQDRKQSGIQKNERLVLKLMIFVEANYQFKHKPLFIGWIVMNAKQIILELCPKLE